MKKLFFVCFLLILIVLSVHAIAQELPTTKPEPTLSWISRWCIKNKRKTIQLPFISRISIRLKVKVEFSFSMIESPFVDFLV